MSRTGLICFYIEDIGEVQVVIKNSEELKKLTSLLRKEDEFVGGANIENYWDYNDLISELKKRNQPHNESHGVVTKEKEK